MHGLLSQARSHGKKKRTEASVASFLRMADLATSGQRLTYEMHMSCYEFQPSDPVGNACLFQDAHWAKGFAEIRNLSCLGWSTDRYFFSEYLTNDTVAMLLAKQEALVYGRIEFFTDRTQALLARMFSRRCCQNDTNARPFFRAQHAEELWPENLVYMRSQTQNMRGTHMLSGAT